MDNQGRGLIRGLENWAKRVTNGYRDVNVRNMTSSFRDGLAFCAIIHHYRPDLIDFESLDRKNILENNSLAFSVAERQLGVPALLDAEDMAKFEEPDRLSIITYLSQLHNCFENQNKVKTLKPTKRPQANSDGPLPKVSAARPKVFPINRNEVCHACNHRVFILERLLVDSKLYHTTCFRCSKCQCLLNPGTYIESDTPGLYECAVCLPEENSYSMDTQDTSYDSSEEKNSSINDAPPKTPLAQNNTPIKSPLSKIVNNARSDFLQHSLAPKSPELKKFSPILRNGTSSSESIKRKSVLEDTGNGGISVKDKISVFESNRNSRTESNLISETSNSISLTSSPTSPSSDSPAPAKSPRTNAILSHNSSSAAQQPQEASSSEKISAFGNVDASLSKETPKASLRFSSQLSKTSDSESDKPNCDNTTSILNKVPNSTARHSLQLESSSKEENTSKISPNKFQIGEYKSPFKTSRDIFQTNLSPLKLSIPSASSTPKKEPSSLPITPITSPDASKISSIEIPQIRSTYAKTLPRPGSDGTLSPKDRANQGNSGSETNLSSNVFLSKWNNTSPRRSSLGSADGKNDLAVSEDASGSIKSLTESNKGSSVTSLKEKDRFQYPSDLGSNLRNESSPFKKEFSSTPVPSIRHSLEIKKLSTPKTLEPNIDINTSSKSPSVSSEKPEVEPSADALQQSSKQLSQNESNIAAKKDTVKTKAVKSSKAEKLYPDDLNPFGDDEEEEYPEDLNPFGDDDEEEETAEANTGQASGVKVVLTNDYDESKNPFASDDDEDDAASPQPKSVPPRLPPSQNSSTYSQNGVYASMSPTGSLRGTMKKRLAPKPPKLSDIFPNDSQDSEADVSFNSLKSSPTGSRISLQTPSPKLRKSKPAPPPPPVLANRQTSQSDVIANSKQMKDADNMKLKSTSASAEKEAAKQLKKKKRPAPPVPIPKRKDNKKIPLKEIIREMKEIEEKQRECERQGREIEILIRDRDKDEEASVEEEEYIMQLFELVNQKNALFRRQAELMYIKRSQRLEEQQAEIELQIRQLIEKPDKKDEDKVKEEELILELMDIVDQRNCIIDSIEMDRRRELEEDASVQEQIEIKNGDLPIAAEIKEKNTGKDKKKDKKAKKDKKKKKEDKDESKKKDDGTGDSKKSSSKRKGLFK
ncbi:MICAL-like protein 2 [Trichonephila inaurata madagascariensis]|uniref:MICAL-like protein 2 n=1 Tax=Trichonephila inaurata madagascariensis TaxID=2747483 RepID=A0A8X7C788_9ARAC|nr:MICAL-like protein 2 [Trichonephila inaurata madagascariensis]